MLQILAVLVCLGLIRVVPLALRRRSERASHTLARDIGDTSFQHIRKLSNRRHIEGDCGAFLARAMKQPGEASNLLFESSHATSCRLPDGLAWDNRDSALWERFSKLAIGTATEVATSPTSARCLDLLGLARDSSLGTGTAGILLARRLTGAVLEPCAQVLYSLESEQAAAAEMEIEALRVSTPALAQAFREQNFFEQVATFGASMRAADVDSLSPALRALAGRAKPLALGFVDTFRAHGVWLSMTKSTRKAMAALELAPQAKADAMALAEREANSAFAKNILGLTFSWSQADEAHRRRLEALQLLAAALQLSHSPPEEHGLAPDDRFAPIRVLALPGVVKLQGNFYTIKLLTQAGAL